jgi:hypothetical protein
MAPREMAPGNFEDWAVAPHPRLSPRYTPASATVPEPARGTQRRGPNYHSVLDRASRSLRACPTVEHRAPCRPAAERRQQRFSAMRADAMLLTVACVLPAAVAFTPSAIVPRMSAVLARSRPAILSVASGARQNYRLPGAVLPLAQRAGVMRGQTALRMSSAAPPKKEEEKAPVELPTNEDNENLLKIRCCLAQNPARASACDDRASCGVALTPGAGWGAGTLLRT